MRDNRIWIGMAVAGVLAMTGCGRDNEFRIEGDVEGAADRSIVLEKADFQGRWTAIDSTRTDKNGKFRIEATAPGAPEIYRLSMDGRFIYLPVDHTDRLTVTSTASNFGSDFSVKGTEQAEQMAQFEKELHALDFNDASKREEFKKTVFTKYLKEARGSVFSYYVLTKTVDGKPLYDINDMGDLKYYAAVATAFDQYKPEDPHTLLLREASMNAMRKRNTEAGKQRVFEAEETGIIDMTLPDEEGNERKLSDFTGKGKKTVLIVSMMNEAESPAVNKALADVYKRGGVEFYHVSVDDDQYAWREASRNLPWTTVFDAQGMVSGVLTKYNVTSLPTFFIYDSAGNLTARALTVKELSSKL